MDAKAASSMSLARTLFRLGRVSNLPTVWSNCLAGAGLATANVDPGLVLLGAGAMSLVYTGGMFLNDAFDQGHDQARAPARPIPSGAIRGGTVYALGFLQLALGVLCIGVTTDWSATGAAVALAALVVVYDAWHKGNPLSPVLMAGCRALVYVTLGLLVSERSPRLVLWMGTMSLVSYVVGLTWLAKLESRGFTVRVPGGFATFIAGISLVDAILLCSVGRFDWALVAALGFPATLALQRFVRGT